MTLRLARSNCRSFATSAGHGFPRDGTGALYLVPTPIGNLRDITLRSLDVLRASTLLLAEDTRTSRRLLTAYGLLATDKLIGDDVEDEEDASESAGQLLLPGLAEDVSATAAPGTTDPLDRKRLISCNQHNSSSRLPLLLAHLERGGTACLLSEAGMPTISDPGSRIVWAVRQAGHPVYALPGPCAAVAAIASCGWDTHAHYFTPPQKTDGHVAVNKEAPRSTGWVFLGFLPPPSPQQLQVGRAGGIVSTPSPSPRALLVQAIATGLSGSTVVLYESPARVGHTLRELANACEGEQTGPEPPVGKAVLADEREEVEPMSPSQLRKSRRAAILAARADASVPGLKNINIPGPSTLNAGGEREDSIIRPVFIAREMTKMHEQTEQFGSLHAAADAIRASTTLNTEQGVGTISVLARGEFTIIIGPRQAQLQH